MNTSPMNPSPTPSQQALSDERLLQIRDELGTGVHQRLFINIARAIESEARARYVAMETRAELAEQAHVCAAEERDHLRALLAASVKGAGEC